MFCVANYFKMILFSLHSRLFIGALVTSNVALPVLASGGGGMICHFSIIQAI